MSGTFRYSSPLIIPDSSDVKDTLTQQELTYVFNALRTLATQLDAKTGALSPLPDSWPTIHPLNSMLGNNINKIYAQCSTNIGYGAMVNFFNFSPTQVKARPAQASSYTIAAGGFCNNPDGYVAGEWGEFVAGMGVNTGISGLVPGTWYFLDPATLTGQVTPISPAVPGQIYQCVGQAISDTSLIVGSLNNWLII